MSRVDEIAIDAAKNTLNPTEELQEPANPVESAVEPANPVESAVEPANPVESAVEPADPVEPAPKPAEPVQIPGEPAGTVKSAIENPSEVEKTIYNDYAFRVAYIMRSYLSIRPSTNGTDIAADARGATIDQCKAMMEVVRADNGRWNISKFIAEHSHPVSTAGAGDILPTVGMSFESMSMSKAFYIAYSEKMGFEVKTGSGRRSKGTRMLVLQRFFCSKGNYAIDGEKVKTKRGPYKEKSKKDGADNNVGVVIRVESSDERVCDVGTTSNHLQIVGDSGNDEGSEGQEKTGAVGNPGQLRLLRDLGVKVSKYSNEERRDVICKYMKKRGNRQGADRSVKFTSRQALANRRQRGFGGKFLSKEESQLASRQALVERRHRVSGREINGEEDSQTVSRQEEPVEEEPEVPAEVIANAGGAPVVGMVFENEDKAYEYYINYAGNKGFSVRKGWWDKSANITQSRVYVCSKEGLRPKNATNESRTGCPARMAIKITSTGRYRVTEFFPDHNHQLAAPLDMQMLMSQRPLAKAQLGVTQQNANLIPSGYKNYIRGKRKKDMKIGDARVILEYFRKTKGENPSFYYAIQVDEDDQMTNVFWADARSMTDYYYFGDVVCFDTSYKDDDYGRPFVQFTGVNHHKQLVIFGLAFLYDGTTESFKWLFETFKTAMAGQQPKTLLTAQGSAISDVIALVYPGTVHRLCVKQIYQNSVKHLADAFKCSETFAHDFNRCLYDIEEEEEFLSAWETLLENYNLKDNERFARLFEEKGKWAPVYRQTFCADIQNALRGENLNNMFKEYLNHEMDLSHFFRQHEKSIDERRYAELQADCHANQDTPRIPPLRLLWQAASAYTPAIFDMFRREFELFMNCTVYNCGEAGILSRYKVTVKEKSKSHFVRFDLSDGTVICTCQKFDFVGIQCCHVLKVLDFRNIKELPAQYILKRWRKDAKAGNLKENHGIPIDADTNSTESKRYNSLCRILYRIAERAADNIDAFTLMVSQSDQMVEQLERILQTKLLEKPSITNANKAITTNAIEGQIANQDSNNETQQISRKRKKDGSARRRNQSGLEMNGKKLKVRKGQSDEAEFASRDAEPPMVSNDIASQTRIPSNQFFAPGVLMQGSSFSQFGLGTSQGFQSIAQFGQDSSASALQQPFHVSTHLGQNTMPGFPTPDMHSLQFVGSNPQLDPQSGGQGHCAIPVWDFL